MFDRPLSDTNVCRQIPEYLHELCSYCINFSPLFILEQLYGVVSSDLSIAVWFMENTITISQLTYIFLLFKLQSKIQMLLC